MARAWAKRRNAFGQSLGKEEKCLWPEPGQRGEMLLARAWAKRRNAFGQSLGEEDHNEDGLLSLT